VIWQVGTRRRIGLGLVLKSGLPTGDEIGLTSGPHKLANKERKEEVMAEPNRIIPAQVRESIPEGSNVLQTV
jgi:hypothetical protein